MSDVSVDIIKNRSGEAPDLPSGANLSGVSTAATLQVTNLNPTHINASGVTTATTFSGSMKSTSTPTLGLGVTINSSGLNISGVATAGIVSATTLYGDGSNLTGVAMSIAPVSYNPDVNDNIVPTATGIGITFTKRIIAGSGNVTLSIANAGVAGTVVENFGVGSSVTINQLSISIDPTSDLTAGETYHLSYPSGAFTNTSGDVSYVGTAYTFGVKPYWGYLWAMGYNANGQLGVNNTTQYSSPIQIPGSTWKRINGPMSGFGQVMLGNKTDNTLWIWGVNTFGGLAQNNTTNYSSPVQIPGTTWSDNFAFGESNSVATKTDGTLWSWGSNNYGQLGQNNRTKYSSPVQIPGTTWSTTADQCVAGGKSASCMKTDGTLWSWGVNQYGELGLNNKTYYSSPVQITGTTWNYIAKPYETFAAIKTDGALWVWGRNHKGQLGVNAAVDYSSPVQVPGTTWSKVVSGNHGSLSTKTDGTLWAWGDNGEGTLGQNNRTSYSSPVQITSGTDWNDIALSNSTRYASKTDGTLYGWGRGDGGSLFATGIANANRSSPTQLQGGATDFTGSLSACYGRALFNIRTS